MLDVVAELDLSAFHARYRAEGRGGAAYDPRLMLAVLIYAYALGERSSRRIERRLMEDVAFRVVAVNQQTDHATTARFRVQHEDAIAQLFGQVLAVCARAGVLRPGLVAIDGTKLTGNASGNANRSAVELAEQILKEAEATDAAEEAAEKAAEKGAGSSGSGSPATFGPRAGRRALAARAARGAAGRGHGEVLRGEHREAGSDRADHRQTAAGTTALAHVLDAQVPPPGQPHRPRQPAVEGSCQWMRSTRS